MSLQQYNDFKERVHNRISERFHTTYTNHDFEVDASDVQILYTWRHDIAWSEIHAVCCHKVDGTQKQLFVTGVRFGYNSSNYEDYELSDIGLFPNSKVPGNAIVFKTDKCRVYVISFDTDIHVYTIAENGNTVLSAVPYKGRDTVKMLIPQPVDVLKRVENNLMYFWVGYENNAIDLMSFKSLLSARDSVRCFNSVIDFNGGTLINIEIRDSALGVSTFAAFTYLENDRYHRNDSTVTVVPVDTRIVLSYCEKLRRGDGTVSIPNMLTSMCPFRIRVPINSDELLVSTSIDQSSIHAIPTVFDYDASIIFSYAINIEYNDEIVVSQFDATKGAKKIDRRFTTAQQKIINTIIKSGPRIFENPEETIMFAPEPQETVMDYNGIQHTWNESENDASSNCVSKPLWELCMELDILRPDRKIKFEQIFAQKLDDPSYSASRAKRIRASFYRMVVLEAAMTLGLSGLIAKYVLDQDSSLSTALLASSPYVLKDIAKLHNWLRDLEEHMIGDTTTFIGHYVSPLLVTKGVEFFDVPISYSAHLDSNSIMCSGVRLVLNSLIRRVTISNQGNFGAIWNNNDGYSNKNEIESLMRDNNEMMTELTEMECLGGIIRATNLMMSNPQFSLNALLPTHEAVNNNGRKMSKLGSLYLRRLEICRRNTPVLSAIPLATGASFNLCVHSLVENLCGDDKISEHFIVPPSFSSNINDDDHEVWQSITDVIMLPLSSIRSNGQQDQVSIESLQQLSKKAFIVLTHVVLDCMYLSPLFDGDKMKYAQVKSLEDFGTQFSRTCGIGNFSDIVISAWKVDARVDDAFIAKTFNHLNSSMLSQSLVTNAINMLMSSESWEMAQELLHIHFKELFSINSELAFSLMSSAHLRNDPLNWRGSLDSCQEYLNYVCGDVEVTSTSMKSAQYKMFMTALVRYHIDLLFNYVNFDSSVPNSAINSVEREIWINVLNEKVFDIFGQAQSDAEHSLAFLSNSQSVQFKSINVYIALLLSLCKIDEAHEIDKTHRGYISNSMLDISTQSLLSERLKLIHSFRNNV